MATDPNAAPVIDPNATPVVDPVAAADPALAAPVADPTASNTPAPDAPVVPKVPDKYELVLPKDSVLPAATIEKTAAIARELGLSNEAAQQVLDSFSATLSAASKAEAEAWAPNTGPAWKARDAEWKQDALKDTEIGGTPDKLTASVNTANLVLGKFFDPSVADFLQESGLGSHREFIRGLARIGKGMSEGSLVLGAPPAPKPKTAIEIMYGEDKQSAA